MKKFKFRLEVLLKYRSMLEETAQLNLAEATSRLHSEEHILTKLKGEFDAKLELMQSQQTNVVNIETLKTYSYYIDKLKEDIVTQSDKIRKAKNHRDDCLESFEAAVRDRKLVDNLRTKRLNEYYEQFLIEDQKLLDELGTQTYLRNKESV